MSDRPEALVLADALIEDAADHLEVARSFDMRPEDTINHQHFLNNTAAATELRRLHAENEEITANFLDLARRDMEAWERVGILMALNAELVEALESVVQVWFRQGGINYVDFRPYMEQARAALAKVETSK